MEYAFSLDNFRQIITSDIVPDDDENGFELDIEIARVIIKKPYTDSDGDKRGNSIFIRMHDGCQIFVNYIVYRHIEYLLTVYKEEGNDTFITLNNESPLAIRKLFNEIWVGIIDAVKVHELIYNNTGKENTKELNEALDYNITIEKFKEQFGSHTPPEALIKLFEFQYSEDCLGYYSATLFLDIINKTKLKIYSDESTFLQSFIEFAQADSLGSTYGFWLIDNKALADCPVVCFGDGGGIHIITQNIKELLRVASYDMEPVIWDDYISFMDKEEMIAEGGYEESLYTLEYNEWMKNELDLEPITSVKEIEQIIENAQKKYKSRLITFLEKYHIE